eukprot:4386450-Pyramimonas_sp.AAC.1
MKLQSDSTCPPACPWHGVECPKAHSCAAVARTSKFLNARTPGFPGTPRAGPGMSWRCVACVF